MVRKTVFIALTVLLAFTGSAAAQESAPEVEFYIEFYDPPVAEAYVWVPPDAPVQEMSLFSAEPGCGFDDPVEVEPGYWVATGHPNSAFKCWTVRLRVVFAPSRAGSDPFCKFVGLEKASFSGSSHTDSYAWENGPYSRDSAGREGHVCSNGKVKMSGNAAVHGDVLHGYHAKRSGNAYVTGSIGLLAEPLAYEPVDPGDAAQVNDNGSIPFSSGGEQPVEDGQLKLSGGDSLELDPGTYFFSKLELSGGSSLHITGPTQIYVTGSVKLSGGSLVNGSQDPSDLKLFLMGGTAKLSGHSDLHATVYGPESKIEFSGGSDFFGTIVGKQLKVSGHSGLHADGGSGSGSADDGEEPATVELVFYNTAT